MLFTVVNDCGYNSIPTVLYSPEINLKFQVENTDLKIYFHLLCVCMYVCMCANARACMCVVTCVWVNAEPEEDIKFPRVRATGGYKLPYVTAGKQSWILFNNNMCYQSLSHLPGPRTIYCD